jgi:glycosyltransferase involved in cell wall biosynthesis
MSDGARVSVVLITLNEERNIDRCLASVSWADEIIVVDSFSSDATIERARAYTGVILQHAYDGDIRQRERGFALATGEWLFYIDADEEVTPELRAEILATVSDPASCDGYSVPRRVMVFGRWIYHGGWYPDHTFRLFRKRAYRAEQAEVHGGFTVDGPKGTLRGELLHYTYATIEQYLGKMNEYTSLQVSNKLAGDPLLRAGWGKILLSPVSHFLRSYVSRKGYKDGVHGFLLAALGAIYTFGLYAKIWEYRMRAEEGKGLLPPITNLELLPYKQP